MKKLAPAMTLIVVLMSPAQAKRVFTNNFDAQNGGASALNYSALTGLDVVGGTVDLLRSGDFGLRCAGGTDSCIDLDGTTNDGGTLQLQTFYSFNAGDTITFSFDLSGNQRGTGSSFDSYFVNVLFSRALRLSSVSTDFAGSKWTPFNDIVLGNLSLGSNIRSQAPFGNYSVSIVAAEAGGVRFGVGTASADGTGPILDNLVLDISSATPEPAQWSLMIGGFGLIGAASRRRLAFA